LYCIVLYCIVYKVYSIHTLNQLQSILQYGSLFQPTLSNLTAFVRNRC